MACPPVPPPGVPANATAEDVHQMIEAAADQAINGATPDDRARAHVRMLILQQYQNALVNCHMSAQVADLTAQVAALKVAIAPNAKAAKAAKKGTKRLT